MDNFYRNLERDSVLGDSRAAERLLRSRMREISITPFVPTCLNPCVDISWWGESDPGVIVVESTHNPINKPPTVQREMSAIDGLWHLLEGYGDIPLCHGKSVAHLPLPEHYHVD